MRRYCSYVRSVRALFFFILFVSYCSSDVSGIANAGDAGKAAKYPSRPIKIILPAAAGGSLGSEARALTPFLEKNLGVPFVIEYVTGADGLLAYNKIYQEKPDGYTMLYFNLTSALVLELTRETAKFETKKYSPAGGWNAKYQVLLVHPDNWKTFAEFVSEAKKRPLTVASVGGHVHLNLNALRSALGIEFKLVPYKASGESIVAVAGKHVDFLLTNETTPKPMIQAGKLRALAVLSLIPNTILPGVPNMKELGYPDMTIIPQYGVFAAPPGTPRAITATFEKAVAKSVRTPEFLKIADNVGISVNFMASDVLGKAIVEQYNITAQNKEFLK